KGERKWPRCVPAAPRPDGGHTRDGRRPEGGTRMTGRTPPSGSLPDQTGRTGPRALQILADRHRRLGRLLADAREAGAAHRPDLVVELMDELDAHRRLVQEVFYPALRRAGDATVTDRLAAR